MATINLSNLELVLMQKAATATDSYQMLIYSKALEQMRSGIVNTVNNVSELPLASDWVGYLYWVVNDTDMYYSHPVFGWYLLNVSNDFGNLWTWGENSSGRLGDDTTSPRSSPGTTAGCGTTWCQVSAGSAASGAIKTDGTLWMWGSGESLGANTTQVRTSPVTPVGGASEWCQVSGGGAFTSAIKTDSTLWTWGAGTSGQLGSGLDLNRSSPGTTAGGGIDWCQVSSGSFFAAAVKTDGTLWTWGNNNSGELGTGATGTARSSPGTTIGGGITWCQVSSATSSHMAAVKTDGTLWTWGTNQCGELGINTLVNRNSPGTTSGGGANWCQVNAGCGHTAAIKTDGTLWTWGCNSAGQLGDATITGRSSPGTTALGGTTWRQVSSGCAFTLAVKTDGTMWSWGRNSNGQLANGTLIDTSIPSQTVDYKNTWIEVSVYDCHSVGLSALDQI